MLLSAVKVTSAGSVPLSSGNGAYSMTVPGGPFRPSFMMVSVSMDMILVTVQAGCSQYSVQILSSWETCSVLTATLLSPPRAHSGADLLLTESGTSASIELSFLW